MKAKEWAAQFVSGQPEHVNDMMLTRFIEEIGVIAAKRGNSKNAVEGAVREQRLKWAAVCRQAAGLTVDMFETALAVHGSQYMQAVKISIPAKSGNSLSDVLYAARTKKAERLATFESLVSGLPVKKVGSLSGRKLATGIKNEYKPVAFRFTGVATQDKGD